MSFFEYRALTPSKRQIRLIRLLPAATHSPLRSLPADGVINTEASKLEIRVSCTISHASLDQPPAYVALSYTWGDLNEKALVLVNGNYLYVTSSLEIALAHLTPEHEPLTLWIDALCINQDDEAEKTDQVQQMRQIYANAASVITWLGPASADSDSAMDWIQHYGATAHNFGIGKKPELRLRRLLQIYESNPEQLPHEGMRTFLRDLTTHLTPSANSQDSTSLALCNLFKRAYWSRMWVVQEVVHAKYVQFVCGDKAVSEDSLNHSLRLLRNFGIYRQSKTARNPQLNHPGSASNYTRNPINILKLRRTAGPFPLIYLIRVLRYFQATEECDKIFALLSFAADATVLNLQPDYDKSWRQIYLETTISLLRNGSWDVLSLCEVQDETWGLPSWVPNFARIGNTAPLQQRALKRGMIPVTTVLQPEFDASGWTRDSNTSYDITQESSETILLHATLVDAVERVGISWETEGSRRWIRELQEFSRADSTLLDSNRLKAVWRTSVADQETRQADQKPRLSEHELEKAHNLLSNLDLDDVDAPMLLSLGLGDHLQQLHDTAHNRRPFSTAKGSFGIGPCKMEPGDFLYVLIGANVPFILRQGTDGRMRLIGEAYVHGIMDGEIGGLGLPVDLVTLY